jgi:hypothetical protein
VPRRDIADRLITVVGGRVDLDQLAQSIPREPPNSKQSGLRVRAARRQAAYGVQQNSQSPIASRLSKGGRYSSLNPYPRS